MGYKVLRGCSLHVAALLLRHKMVLFNSSCPSTHPVLLRDGSSIKLTAVLGFWGFNRWRGELGGGLFVCFFTGVFIFYGLYAQGFLACFFTDYINLQTFGNSGPLFQS